MPQIRDGFARPSWGIRFSDARVVARHHLFMPASASADTPFADGPATGTTRVVAVRAYLDGFQKDEGVFMFLVIFGTLVTAIVSMLYQLGAGPAFF